MVTLHTAHKNELYLSHNFALSKKLTARQEKTSLKAFLQIVQLIQKALTLQNLFIFF